MSATQRSLLFVGKTPEFEQIQRMLADYSTRWKVVHSPKGAAALAHLSSERFDVVAADWHLGDSSGLDFLAQVTDAYPSVVSIILFNAEEDSLKCIGTPHLLLGKPYDESTLTTVLDYAADSTSWTPDEPVRRLVLGMKTVPSPPSLYFRVLKEVRSSLQSLENIGWLIARDPAMSAKLLQLANSASLGLRTRVTNTIEAAVYLGARRIESLILLGHSFAYFEKIRGFRFDIESFCQHSTRVSHYSQNICKAQKAGAVIGDQAFTAGVLHDIGKLALAANYPEQYANAVKLIQTEKCSQVEAETATFGATHAELGACLLASWGLDHAIVEAVARHHKPGKNARKRFTALTAVHAANALDHNSSPNAEPVNLDMAYLEEAGLTDKVEAWKLLCCPVDDLL